MKAFAGLLAVLLMLSCTSLAQTAPAQPAQPTAPAQQAAGDSAKPEAGNQPSTPATGSSPDASTPSTDAAVPSAGGVPVVAFGPGAKVFIEPMEGFGELLAEAIAKKKVPVVLVNEREKADFVLNGDAYVKKPGWIGANFKYLHGRASISVDDARTGDTVFACTETRVDANLVDGEVYKIWAGGCANHLKKALQKK